MKFWKQTLVTVTAFLGISSTVLYTSCVQDSCTSLQCKNGGSCADGFCRCPTGYDGTECENRITDRFVGSYPGATRCDDAPSILDTVDVYVLEEPVTLGLVRRSNPGEVYQGFADGNRITIADRREGNEAWSANAIVNDGRITVYMEYVSDIAQNVKTVCSFSGAKPRDTTANQNN